MIANKTPIMMPNKGIVLNTPDEFLTTNYSPYCRNLEFENENLVGRKGIVKLFSVNIGEQILDIFTYKNYQSIYQFIIFTQKYL
jgi:hypothetical protein